MESAHRTPDVSVAVILVQQVEESQLSYDVCLKALKTLVTMSASLLHIQNPELYARILDAGVCECVVGILNKFGAGSQEQAAAGCTVVKQLSNGSRDLAEHFADSGACEIVVFVASMHIGEADVAEAAAGAMGMLARDSISQSFLLAQAGACDILSQLGNFGFNVRLPASAAQVAGSVCFAFAQLAEASNVTRLLEAGAVDLVVSLLLFHKDNELVVVPGVKALCCLASLNFQCREAVGRAGGCELLVECLTRFCSADVSLSLQTPGSTQGTRPSTPTVSTALSGSGSLPGSPARKRGSCSGHFDDGVAGGAGAVHSSPSLSSLIRRSSLSISLSSLAAGLRASMDSLSATGTPSNSSGDNTNRSCCNDGRGSVISSPLDISMTTSSAPPSASIHRHSPESVLHEDAASSTRALVVSSAGAKSIAYDGCEAIMHLALLPDNSDRLGACGACVLLPTVLCPRLLDVPFGSEICSGAMLHLSTYGNETVRNRELLKESGADEQCDRLKLSHKASYRARENVAQLREYLGGGDGAGTVATDESRGALETSGSTSTSSSGCTSTRTGGGAGLDGRRSEVFLGVVNGSEAAAGTVPLAVERREYNTTGHGQGRGRDHAHTPLLRNDTVENGGERGGGDEPASGIYEI